VEVKKIGFTAGADRQLFEYVFHLGVPMAILTDGQEWSFYLPGEQGRYDERRVYKIDLLELDISELAEKDGIFQRTEQTFTRDGRTWLSSSRLKWCLAFGWVPTTAGKISRILSISHWKWLVRS